MLRRLAQRVRRAVLGAGLQGQALVVAVSGGPDSLTLLHLLAHLQRPLSLRLTVAHLDHALRPASAAEAQFVAAEAGRLGLPFFSRRVEVLACVRDWGLSLEEAARRVRYRFLAEVMQEVGARAVATGHTADDQAETVLLHLVRGSGLAGLAGMRPLSTVRWPGGPPVTVFRPLLGVRRWETEALCTELGLSPVADESNLETAFRRNRIRLEVLPLLAQVNPGISGALVRLARAVALDLDYLDAVLERLWPQVVRPEGNGLSINREAFARLHPSLQRHLLRRAYEALYGAVEDLEQAHLEGAVGLLTAPPGRGRRVSWPGGVVLHAGPGWAWLGRGDPPCPLPPLEGEHPLAVPGTTAVGGWRVRAELLSPPPPHRGGAPYTALLDAAALGSPLVVRARRPGDRFWPLGMRPPEGEGERWAGKRLQDFLVDARVPRHWRDRVPLVVSPRGVAWVVGWRIAHWARVTPATTTALHLSFHRPE